jgi:16S rRNA (guanine527-N7)-methyltransferase
VPDSTALSSNLRSGLHALGEDPDTHPCDSYLVYLDLLEKWNKAYNLSGIRQKGKMLTHHVLDSLSVLPYLRGSRGLDVGTGAGLPGLILALAKPDMHWVLLDSNRKKTLFLNQIRMELGCKNIEIVHARAEDYRSDQLFSTVTCRALMSSSKFCELTEALLERNGRIIMMKGLAVKEETREIDVLRYSAEVQPLNVPGLEASRHLVMIERRPLS